MLAIRNKVFVAESFGVIAGKRSANTGDDRAHDTKRKQAKNHCARVFQVRDLARNLTRQ